MKYRLPRNCKGVSHGGRPVPVAPDGTVDLAAADAAELAAHELEPAPVRPARQAGGVIGGGTGGGNNRPASGR